MILAARGAGGIVKGHLAECSWCGLYFEFLSRYPLAGELPLVDAPRIWIKKAIAVGTKPAIGVELKSLVAKLSFDSWAMPVPEGIRGAGIMEERRVCFEAAGKTFDLRAEHKQNRWDFTAKITDETGIATEWALMIGQEEHIPNADGFYQWSSVRPPKKIRLRSEQNEIETPELSWKKSRQE